mmetsp:Transcript_25986/g.68815  ORF Transcript_25986/g.68815 Transcript_25986/m.68815 type:complete len:242 (+) Transcript_25986:274-999(+)
MGPLERCEPSSCTSRPIRRHATPRASPASVGARQGWEAGRLAPCRRRRCCGRGSARSRERTWGRSCSCVDRPFRPEGSHGSCLACTCSSNSARGWWSTREPHAARRQRGEVRPLRGRGSASRISRPSACERERTSRTSACCVCHEPRPSPFPIMRRCPRRPTRGRRVTLQVPRGAQTGGRAARRRVVRACSACRPGPGGGPSSGGGGGRGGWWRPRTGSTSRRARRLPCRSGSAPPRSASA